MFILSVVHIMKAYTTPVHLIALCLLLSTATAAVCREYSESYITEFRQQSSEPPVYKFTYSYSIPHDAVDAEEVDLVPGPSRSSVEDHLRQQERIAETAQALDEARRRREAAREEAEKKRLERLALLNQARRPRSDYERNIFIGRPWKPWWGRPGRHHRGHGQPYPEPLPYRGHSPSHLPLPGSSFPGR